MQPEQIETLYFRTRVTQLELEAVVFTVSSLGWTNSSATPTSPATIGDFGLRTSDETLNPSSISQAAESCNAVILGG